MPDLSIMPEPSPNVHLTAPTPKPLQPLEVREFGDAVATRKRIYDDTLQAARQIEPLTNDKHTLRLTDVDWADPESYSKKERKQAILTGETLARRMKGTWQLLDAAGKPLDSRQQIIARVPYLSDDGTFIHRGSEYGLRNQQRLQAGAFTRIKGNGEIENHVNILPGNGVSHRYFLDPAKGVFKLKLGQAEMPLIPLLRAMGAKDDELNKAWGDKLFASNYKADDSSVLTKLKKKLLRKVDQNDDEPIAQKKLVEAFERMQIDPEISKRTLGGPHKNINKDTMLAITKKLLAVSRGQAEPDDRDHLAYQQIFGPEDLFAERLRRDHGQLRRNLFKKISFEGNLTKMPSGVLTPQLEHVLTGSGLASALEEINPLELLDKQSQITKMGEGGVGSTDSVPDESRAVQPSHMGFVDALRTPESFRAGIDLNLARAARKGNDGRLYTSVLDKRGRETLKSPQDLLDANLATPDAMKWPSKRIPVMRGGKLSYVLKTDVDYTLPSFENAFSHVGNLVPFKSAMKGQRVAMASRMLTQALPLVHAEAPWIQSGMPGSNGARSFEDEYGKHMGAVSAEQGGRVVSSQDGVLSVKHDDGSVKNIELFEHSPFNRKTFWHQTPMVQPGETFKPGQLLVKSNYTDKHGAMALGLNARTAYTAWKGLNYEDAIVISQSMADRLESEHMYQHALEPTDKHRLGKSAYVQLYPGKFDKDILSRMDERGAVKPGQVVQYGEPLLLAAHEKDQTQDKIHKRNQPGFTDASVLWKHHDPGVVTDVEWGKHGPVILVKSYAKMQIGDKMTGRHGNKGVVSAIVPDENMLRDKNGQPFEVLMNPRGTVSRGNPSNMIETALGKLAAHRGKPIKVPDFEEIDDLAAWAKQQLRQNGLSDVEDASMPDGQVVPKVFSGNAFFMKLHHTSEGKAQGRGSGGYSADETPSKGGESGCFAGDTLVDCFGPRGLGDIDISTIAEYRLVLNVPTRRPGDASAQTGVITDWFCRRARPEELIEIELENGQKLVPTKNHGFVLTNGTVKLAGDLQPDDELMETRNRPNVCLAEAKD